MHLARLAFACGLILTLALSASAADWPQFRGPGRAGRQPRQGPAGRPGAPTENVAWKTELPGPGTSSPVVVGDRIFLTCYTGYNVPGQAAASMDDLKRHLVCLDRDRRQDPLDHGRRRPSCPSRRTIRDDHGYASSTPAADGERVYVFFGKSGVFAFDHDGKQLWQADVGSRAQRLGLGRLAGAVRRPGHRQRQRRERVAGRPRQARPARRSGGPRASASRGTRRCWCRRRAARRNWSWRSSGKVLGFDPATGRAAVVVRHGHRLVHGAEPGGRTTGVVYCIGGRIGRRALAVRAGGRGDVTETHRLWTGTKGSNVSSPVFHDGHLYWMHDEPGHRLLRRGRRPARSSTRSGSDGPARSTPRRCWPTASSTTSSRDGRTFVVAAKPKFELLAIERPAATAARSTPAPPSPAAGCSCARTSSCTAWERSRRPFSHHSAARPLELRQGVERLRHIPPGPRRGDAR